MLAGEFLPLASFFDRLEVMLRRLGRWVESFWVGLPAVVKVLLVLTCIGILAYGAYYLLFGG
jgi:hypothetical protein